MYTAETEGKNRDRRRSSFSMLSIKLGKDNLLIDLVEECLQDSPDKRPNADNLVSRISEESSRAKDHSEHMLSKIINEHFKPDKLSKIQQAGDDKDVLLAENEALKNELEECKVKLGKVMNKYRKIPQLSPSPYF